MMSLKRDGGGFQHIFCEEGYGDDLKYLAFKKGEEFNIINAERYINFVYPIAKIEEIDEFNKRANEVNESWFMNGINDGTITIR